MDAFKNKMQHKLQEKLNQYGGNSLSHGEQSDSHVQQTYGETSTGGAPPLPMYSPSGEHKKHSGKRYVKFPPRAVKLETLGYQLDRPFAPHYPRSKRSNSFELT
jgi:hypothetical protein